MNKGDLAAAVADRTGMTKGDANRAVEAVFGCISEAMRKGEEVRVLGFGNFVVSNRAATMGRNPKTREPIEIRASKQAKFRAGKGLKDALNG